MAYTEAGWGGDASSVATGVVTHRSSGHSGREHAPPIASAVRASGIDRAVRARTSPCPRHRWRWTTPPRRERYGHAGPRPPRGAWPCPSRWCRNRHRPRTWIARSPSPPPDAGRALPRRGHPRGPPGSARHPPEARPPLSRLFTVGDSFGRVPVDLGLEAVEDSDATPAFRERLQRRQNQ